MEGWGVSAPLFGLALYESAAVPSGQIIRAGNRLYVSSAADRWRLIAAVHAAGVKALTRSIADRLARMEATAAAMALRLDPKDTP